MLKAQQRGLETIEKWFETTNNWSKLNGKVLNPPKMVSKASKVVGNQQKGLETVKNQLESEKRWFESVEIGLGGDKNGGNQQNWVETIQNWLESGKKLAESGKN